VEYEEQGGINWTWFKVQNGNLVAIFRLHYGEDQLQAFRKLARKMTRVDNIGVPFAPWREKCEVVADYTGKESGYSDPEVVKAYGWLNDMFRETADEFELKTCAEGSLRHLEYHGVYIVRRQPMAKPKKGGCRLGYCAKKNSHYQGGGRKDIEEGRCPICKGPLKKQK